MDPQAFPGLGQKTVRRLIIPGRFAMEEAKAFHRGLNGEFHPHDVVGRSR